MARKQTAEPDAESEPTFPVEATMPGRLKVPRRAIAKAINAAPEQTAMRRDRDGAKRQ